MAGGVDVVLLAIPGDFVRTHAADLTRKVVIDATNNFRGAVFHFWPEITAAVPNAELYRAFNTVGWDVQANPVLGGVEADMFYAGPEGPSKEVVERLIAEVGLRPVWVGGTDQVETVDGVLRLWYMLSQTRGRRIAFRLIAD